MELWQKHLLLDSLPVQQAIDLIDNESHSYALVINERGEFVALLTDTTIRKFALKGISSHERIKDALKACADVVRCNVMEPSALAGTDAVFQTREGITVKLDRFGKPQSVEVKSALERLIERTPILLMVGGNGKRLRPLTEHCPKPLLKVNGKPLLERTLESLVGQGFRNFYFSVNYKREMIESHFGDGSRWSARIDYLREPQMLGTAGSLRLIPRHLTEAIIVMNGDLFSENHLPVTKLLDYHKIHRAQATMAVAPYHWKIPYGVVETNGELLSGIREKPVHVSYINAGMYVLEPEMVTLIPTQGPYDMPSLFEQVMQGPHKACAFALREEWIDIGCLEEFEKVCSRFKHDGTNRDADIDFSVPVPINEALARQGLKS